MTEPPAPDAAEPADRAAAEQERALAAARAEGRAEARAEAARHLAAAEFRLQAAGRLADPDAALEVLDQAKLLDGNGEPDRKAIAGIVERLVQPAPSAAPGSGHVPAGPRGGTAPPSDFLRAMLTRPPRG